MEEDRSPSPSSSSSQCGDQKQVWRREKEGFLEGYGEGEDELGLGKDFTKLGGYVYVSMSQGGEGQESSKVPWIWWWKLPSPSKWEVEKWERG